MLGITISKLRDVEDLRDSDMVLISRDGVSASRCSASKFDAVVKPRVVYTYESSYGTVYLWIRLWSDGYKEQAGFMNAGTGTIVYIQPFSSVNYSVVATNNDSYNNWPSYYIYNKLASGFSYNNSNGTKFSWYACGY